MYENGKMIHVKIILRIIGEGIRRMMVWMNLTKIYCKYLCKCHNIFPVQKYDNNFFLKEHGLAKSG
jgi:hypothetical protein